MRKLFSLIVFHFCVVALCTAQAELVESTIDLVKEQTNHVTLIGKAKNLSDNPLDLSYTMDLINKSSGNSSTSNQSGKFKLLPNEEKTLSSSQTNVAPSSKFEVVLKIYQADKIIAEKVLKSDPAFFSAYNALAVTPPKSKKTTNNNTATKKLLESILTKEPKKEIQNSTSDAIEIGGLIIDNTRTKIGRDFYEFFYGKWVDPKESDNFSIIIRELPSRGGRVARIAIEVDGNVVAQRVVQPRQEIVEAMAQQSVNIVQNYLAKKKDLNSELDPDQQGSGIF